MDAFARAVEAVARQLAPEPTQITRSKAARLVRAALLALEQPDEAVRDAFAQACADDSAYDPPLPETVMRRIVAALLQQDTVTSRVTGG
jgi:hypothetical protein